MPGGPASPGRSIPRRRGRRHSRCWSEARLRLPARVGPGLQGLQRLPKSHMAPLNRAPLNRAPPRQACSRGRSTAIPALPPQACLPARSVAIPALLPRACFRGRSAAIPVLPHRAGRPGWSRMTWECSQEAGAQSARWARPARSAKWTRRVT
ncbi:hypothetical protein Mro03_32990 [Microbispora rosea subsp. rosea]|nr:hypothetical protein Mro03_32990 [Microbispora rosea subsp. rosea]